MENSLPELKINAYSVVQLGDQFFAFPAEHVLATSKTGNYTKIPASIPDLFGVVNLKNSVLPIVLPDRWLKSSSSVPVEEQQIIVLKLDDILIALQFDAIIGVFTDENSQAFEHPYRTETPYFLQIIAIGDGLLSTIVDTQLLIREIKSLSI